MKAFLITWSEGDPTLVIAADFNKALDRFVREVRDGDDTDEQVRSWIDSVQKVADKVLNGTGRGLSNF